MQKEYIILSRSNQKAKNGSPYAILKLSAQKGETHSLTVWDLNENEGPNIADIITLDLDVLKNIRFPKVADCGFFRTMRHDENDPLMQLIPRPISKDDWDNCLDNLLNLCTDSQLIDFIQSERDVLYHNYIAQTAGTSMHHAFIGGLLNHTHELLRILLAIHSVLPPFKIERCIIAILFHDYGKLKEYDPQTLEGTEYMYLLGHTYISAHVLHNKLNAAGISNQETIRIVHCVLAHHGEKEFGSPVLPCSQEAIIVNHLDNLSAKTYNADETANMEKSFMLGTKVVK